MGICKESPWWTNPVSSVHWAVPLKPEWLHSFSMKKHFMIAVLYPFWFTQQIPSNSIQQVTHSWYCSGRFQWHSGASFNTAQYFSISVPLYTHNSHCIVSFTYATVISDVDFGFFGNKVSHNCVRAFLSCQVQRSILLKTNIQKVIVNTKIL